MTCDFASSSNHGIIYFFRISGYDIASFFCLIPVSYFGGRVGASKPKWVGWGVVIMGLGFFMFSLPHFLVGPYRAANPESNVCGFVGNETMTECSEGNERGSEDLSWNVWFFFVAQLLHGIGEKMSSLNFHLTSISFPLYRRFTSLHPRCDLHRRERFKEDVFSIFR